MLEDQPSSSSSFFSSKSNEEGVKRSVGQKDVYGEMGSMHSHGGAEVSTTDVMAMLHIQRNLREGPPTEKEKVRQMDSPDGEEVRAFITKIH
tara:strand:- start:507 stop:782 length:276 start_codon:yes stop_codon:yes gene_type:complete